MPDGNWTDFSVPDENSSSAMARYKRARIDSVWPSPGGPSDQQHLPKEALIMRAECRLLTILAGSCLLAAAGLAEAVPSAVSKTAVEEKGFTLTETYEGSGNTDGVITDINSTVGYIFNPHFSINMGVPYLFVSPSSSKTGATSASGM